MEARDDVQPLVGLLCEGALRVVEEVGVRSPARASNTPTELIELRQAEAVGALDDDRVDVRDVETRLDDGGAYEDVILARLEVDHHRRQLVFRHLSVADGNPAFGDD